MNPSLEQLLQRPDVWRPRDRRPLTTGARCEPTGFTALDKELHGGWPRSALTELLVAQPGIGELFLLTPLLAELSRTQRLQVWINPPCIPYGPALVQRGVSLESLLIVRGDPQHHLWACEQALRSGGCGAVLYWPAKSLRYTELRKLQVAAATENALGFLFREPRAAQQPSPAVLRMQLHAGDEALNTQLAIHIVKQRGYAGGQTLLLPRETTLLPTQTFVLPTEASTPQQTARVILKIIAPSGRKISVRTQAQLSELSAAALQ